MIHADANLLIGISDTTDFHHAAARRLLSQTDPVAVSSIAWTEYQSRPLPAALSRGVRALLRGGIVPFDEPAAELAGRLFHEAGGRRRHRMDTLIAATAMLADAELATTNPADFSAFVPLGLKLRTVG
jgi:predicted nucleic acid-binding protein